MRRVLLCVLVLLVLCACTLSDDDVSSSRQKEESVEESSNEFPSLSDEEIAERVEKHLATMTIEQKAGQMLMAERNAIDCYEIKTYNIGSVLTGPGQNPVNKKYYNWVDVYNNTQSCALQSETQIPLLYSVDAVHGHSLVQGATIFPHNIGLGAANDPVLMYQIGSVTAKELARTGVNWNFSPAVSVVKNIQWGRTYESFGENPEIHRQLVGPYIRGLQSYQRIATAKHFIADGGADIRDQRGGNWSIDQGNVSISIEEIERIHLPGYIEAIDAGILSVMVAYNSVHDVKLHQHEEWITGYLKGKLGFKGIVVSDYEAIKQIPNANYYQQVVLAINAGLDVLMEPHSWKEAHKHIVSAVKQGDIPMERIDDAVRRVLTVKYQVGLFENPRVEKTPGALSTDEHKQVAREAVRKSLVLLKNEQDILPLKKDSNILLLGPGADDLSIQTGGWTVRWQGAEPGDVIEGTTISDAFKFVVQGNGRKIYTNVSDAKNADVAVVVLAEIPYAEGYGDNGYLDLFNGQEGEGSYTSHPDNMKALQQAKESGLPIVVILLSGRPLLVTDYINDWNAFIAAWLPGSEGGNGIADVIFGDYDFTGRLPVTWPKDNSQLSDTIMDKQYNSDKYLFPYGFGLSYKN